MNPFEIEIIEIEELERKIAPESTAAVIDGPSTDQSDSGFLE